MDLTKYCGGIHKRLLAPPDFVTHSYDLIEKFNRYKDISSLQQIIFIEQYWTEVKTYIRQPDNEWRLIENTEKSTAIPVANGFVELNDIYQKINY